MKSIPCPLRIELIVLLIGIFASTTASAQTLSEKLNAESATTLAMDAIEQGSAVRGAILFPKQTLACATCHSPGADDLLGPDLARLPKDTTNEHLVESILKPSKSIRKGFETSTVVTSAGKTYSGRIVAATDKSQKTIVLREASVERRLRTFDSSNVEDISTSDKSSMPERLADQLANRQQFLDLVRYMIELRDSASDANSTSANSPAPSTEHSDQSELNPGLHGLTLIDEFRCASCHSNDLANSGTPANAAPDLSWLAGRTNPAFIEQMILDPHQTKPGTRMPNLLANLPAAERQSAARELTHFVHSLGQRNSPDVQQLADSPPAAQNVQQGQQLFHTVGCVACHSPRDENGSELLPDDSVSLGAVGRKYQLIGLVEFLENPHASRPGGRMPNMKLSRWEAIDVASYLLRTSTTAAPFTVDQQLAAAGRKRFSKLRCDSCHRQSTASTISHSQPASLSKLQPDAGCLSERTGSWPKYQFTDSERTQLRAGLTATKPLTNEQHIQVALATFRCDACHQRGSLGGVNANRNQFFKTANPNLGPQGRIPPDLTGVGAKLQAKWLRQVLVSGKSSRPYLETRMPQHGAENIGHLVELFQQDKVAAVTYPEIKGRDQQKKFREAGHVMAGSSGLNCVACHTFQEKPGATMSALDLTEMSERLKPDWFYHYMLNPQRFNRGTVMPSFWPSGRSFRKDILDGTADQQIAGMWEWLSDGRQARTPRGLIREPMQLLATDEAVMLRRSWPGIGKRGIGVGYPGQVNLAFDAEQMRIAIVWRGKFADPGGVWRSQGHGVANPLSREQTKFLPGPEVDDANQPWVPDDGRPPKHRFKGYELDELRRPKFLYEFDGIAIQDYSTDVSDDSGNGAIRRTLTFKSNVARPNVVFRIATKDAIRPTADGFEIGKSIVVEVISPVAAKITNTKVGSELHVPLELESGTTQLVLEYRWK